jgi:hypothetical protein
MQKTFIVVMGLIGLLLSPEVWAEENAVVMAEMVVIGEKLVTPTKQPDESVYTGSEVTQKGMEIQGVKANTSIYEAIDILPGISVESPETWVRETTSMSC